MASRTYKAPLDLASPQGYAMALKEAVDAHQSGSLVGAEKQYNNLLRADPDHSATWHMLGICQMQQEKNEEAVAAYEKAIKLDPDQASYHKNLGVVYQSMRKYAQSEIVLRRALDIEPDHVVAMYNLGVALEKQGGRFDEAFEVYTKVVALQPLPEAYNNMASIFLRQKEYDSALKMAQKAVELRPDYANALSNIGLSQFYQQNFDEALKYSMAAVYMAPSEAEHKIRLSTVVNEVRLESFNADIKKIILLCLEDNRVRWEEFSRIWIKSLSLDPVFAPWVLLLKSGSYEGFCEGFDALESKEFLRDPYLLRGLKSLISLSPGVEVVLTYTRRYALEKIAAGEGLTQSFTPFLFAMSESGFCTEYVFLEDESEKQAVSDIEAHLNKGDLSVETDATKIVIYACYRPLHGLEASAQIIALIKDGKPANLNELVERQITMPQEEREIAANIESLTEQHEDSERFHDIYDANPYPRWKSVNVLVPTEELFQTFDESLFDDRDSSILIAGCGTGQHSISIALSLPQTKILAVDFSRATLAYAVQKSREFGVRNIDYKQADILNLGDYKKRFNYIECMGVIHHISDYKRAFEVLAKLTKPGGVMKIGVYSDVARSQVTKVAQEYLTEQGFDESVDGIRKARRLVMTSPIQQVAALAGSSDFYSMNSRYHMFPMDEHWFTLPEIKEIIEDIGMVFLGFDLRSPDLAMKYQEAFPDDPKMSDLDNWHVFEQQNPRTFMGMYNMMIGKPKASK